MKKQNYIVLIRFAAPLTRQNLASIAPQVKAAVRRACADSEAIYTSDTAVAFVGASESNAMTLFHAVAQSLRAGDQLTVAPLGDDLATSQRALRGWLARQTQL